MTGEPGYNDSGGAILNRASTDARTTWCTGSRSSVTGTDAATVDERIACGAGADIAATGKPPPAAATASDSRPVSASSTRPTTREPSAEAYSDARVTASRAAATRAERYTAESRRSDHHGPLTSTISSSASRATSRRAG